jgi:hypothetical protein
MTQKPALYVAWSAQAEALAEQPKEPPRRPSLAVEQFSEATHKFDYNWEERLKAVDPRIHPLMRFSNYHIYEARLYKAVEILNATDDVESDHAIECVLEAFWGLRQARHNQNVLNREENRGRNDLQMAGEDMEALLDLAMAVKPGSAVRVRLEHDWKRGILSREAAQKHEGMTSVFCNELRSQLRETIPDTPKAVLLIGAINEMKLRQYHRDLAASTGISVVK